MGAILLFDGGLPHFRHGGEPDRPRLKAWVNAQLGRPPDAPDQALNWSSKFRLHSDLALWLRFGTDFKTAEAMILKPLMTAIAVVVGISGMAGIGSAPAQAQNAMEAEMLGFHQLCDKGDRKACIRFGILIGQNQQRHADWRRAPADWFWWER
jgi:hypothetical protein